MMTLEKIFKINHYKGRHIRKAEAGCPLCEQPKTPQPTRAKRAAKKNEKGEQR